MPHLDSWLAFGVLLSTAATDAVYVQFNSAVASKRRVPAATWSSLWYLLSASAVISHTKTGSTSSLPQSDHGSAPTSP